MAADLETRAGDTTLTQQLFVIKRDMRLLENFTGFLLDVQEPLQTVHAQRGDMLDLNVNELTLGARGAAHLSGELFGQRLDLFIDEFGDGHAVLLKARAEIITFRRFAGMPRYGV